MCTALLFCHSVLVTVLLIFSFTIAVKYLVWKIIIILVFQNAGWKERAAEWRERAEKFHEGVACVQHLATKFKVIPNQAIHYYFFPYLWDILGVLQTCSTFIKWLGKLCNVKLSGEKRLHGNMI